MEKVGAYTDRATEIGEWRPGNPGLGQQATPMLAAYFNMLQRELVGVVQAADIELDPEDDGQLLQAINALIDLRVPDKLFLSFNVDTVLTSAQMGLLTLDASAGNRLITLPASDAGLGVVDVIVRRVDNSGNRLKVQAAGADKIKFHTHLSATGYPFLVLMGAGDWWHLRSDGAGGWWPIGRHDSDALGRPVFESTTMVSPGGWGVFAGSMFNRSDWPWLWDHAQQSGMSTSEAARVGMEGGWTNGDGATTFRGPEGRGVFMRMLDESRGVDTSVITGTLTNGSAVVASVNFAGNTIAPGMAVTGNGVPANTTITAVTANSVTLSANATTSGVTKLTVTGRIAGSGQLDNLQNITGTMNGVMQLVASGGAGAFSSSIYTYHTGSQGGGSTVNNFVFDASLVARAGAQTRPLNIAYPGRIKLI